MKTSQSITQSSLECPKCGKHTIIRSTDMVFQCINCDFRRDMSNQGSPPHDSSDDAGGLVATCIIILLILMFL
ncbi:MAG: hypothetical protein ACFE0I_08035 [Elainellaceae cyanobacterium]